MEGNEKDNISDPKQQSPKQTIHFPPQCPVHHPWGLLKTSQVLGRYRTFSEGFLIYTEMKWDPTQICDFSHSLHLSFPGDAKKVNKG